MTKIEGDIREGILWRNNSVATKTFIVYEVDSNDSILTALEYLSPSISILLGTIGLIFKGINTTVFTKQGVKDCVTVCLLSLSLTDNGSLFCGLMAACCRICNTVAKSRGWTFFLDPMALWPLLTQGKFFFYDLSTYTTVFIAIERCLCVILPLKFKSKFTLRNSCIVLITVYTFTFLLHVFLFAYTEFRPVNLPKLNASQTFIYCSPTRLLLEDYIQLINQLFLPCVALPVILITTATMIRGLLKSDQFRKRSATQALSNLAKPKREVAEQETENPANIDTCILCYKKQQFRNAQIELPDEPQRSCTEISARNNK